MSAVSELMREMHAIITELKNLNATVKTLRNRKKELESQVLEYLEDSEIPGLKYKEIIVKKTESITHSRLKKKEKEESAIKILESNGVNNPEDVYKALLDAIKGQEIQKLKLKIQTQLPEIV